VVAVERANLHPTGQMPAYEWNFGDVNPPVHAWAAIFLHRTEQALGREDLLDTIHATGPGHFGVGERGIMGLVNQDRLRRILSRMLDEEEFLSPYGIRALSRRHAEHPFMFFAQGQEYRVNYLPAESDTGMFGGNSNWRGPIWMPAKLIEIFGRVDPQALLEGGIAKSFGRAKEAEPAGDSRAARVPKSRKAPLQTTG